MRLPRCIHILVILLLSASFIARAQTDSLRLGYMVHGSVTDARTGRALPAVNIIVPSRNFATVSNSDGVFVIKSDGPVRELVFSCVGYKKLRLTVDGGEVVARMVPDKYLLDPSSIVSGEPLEIVRSAVRRIRDNYSLEPELLRFFYRETLQKRSRYISVSEAVARVYKSSYMTPGQYDRTAVEKGRIIMSQRRRDTLGVKMMGGPTLAATADMVKCRDVLFNDIDWGMYALEMEKPEYIGDRLQFVISFSPVYDAEYPLYKGVLYIDRETLAFTRIEMSMDMRDPIKVTRQLLVRKPVGLRFQPKELSFVLSYRPDKSSSGQEISRLEYCRQVIRFNCDWKKRMIATSFTLVNEMVVTDIVEPAVPVSRQDMFRTTDILSDKATFFFDPAFWENYNIIEPSESLEHAVNRLRK